MYVQENPKRYKQECENRNDVCASVQLATYVNNKKRGKKKQKREKIRAFNKFPNLEGTQWSFQNVRVHNKILGHRQNLENSSMDVIDTQLTKQRKNTHTHHIF